MRGGVEGRTTRFDDLDERRARQLAKELMGDQGDGWRELAKYLTGPRALQRM